MKKPTLRVPKWLADIPVEAHCTQCLTVSFKAQGTGHRPNREEYQKSLQTRLDLRSPEAARRGNTLLLYPDHPRNSMRGCATFTVRT